MAHFAKVVSGVVTQVIVAEPDFFNTFVDDTPGKWIQTSYNTYGGVHYDPATGQPSSDQSKAVRKNYASIGYSYDGTGFYAPQPFPSWTLNSSTYLWESPVDHPDSENYHAWNEASQRWDEVT